MQPTERTWDVSCEERWLPDVTVLCRGHGIFVCTVMSVCLNTMQFF